MTGPRWVEVRCYRFTCPECGMGDGELGHLATKDEVHCMVCLIDEDRHVVLRRWYAAEQDERGNTRGEGATSERIS